jgi:hypothetical protein
VTSIGRAVLAVERCCCSTGTWHGSGRDLNTPCGSQLRLMGSCRNAAYLDAQCPVDAAMIYQGLASNPTLLHLVGLECSAQIYLFKARPADGIARLIARLPHVSIRIFSLHFAPCFARVHRTASPITATRQGVDDTARLLARLGHTTLNYYHVGCYGPTL